MKMRLCCTEEEKGKLQTELDSLDEQMPLPLTTIYAVKNDPKQASPLHLLFKGDYLQPLDSVGARPLGVLRYPKDTPRRSQSPRRTRAPSSRTGLPIRPTLSPRASW